MGSTRSRASPSTGFGRVRRWNLPNRLRTDRELRGQSPHGARSCPSSQQDRPAQTGTGRGTVVNRSEFEQSLGTLYSLYNSVEAAGVEQTSEVVNLEVVTDSVAASHLELDESAKLVLLARIRLAGDTPLALDRAWMPHAIAAPLLGVDWSHTALYDELAKAGAPVPNQGWERLTPILPTPSDRSKLGLRKVDAAFFLERLGCRDGQPIEWRTTIIRGDRYRFTTDWSAGSRSELRPAAT